MNLFVNNLHRRFGGPVGRRAAMSGSHTRATPWVLLAGLFTWLFLMFRQVPCLTQNGKQYSAMCYTDIVPLFYLRGMAEAKLPYVDAPLEYPVLTGSFMVLCQRLVGLFRRTSTDENAFIFFGVNSVLLFCFFLAVLWAHSNMARPWDAMLIAISPAIWTAALINWDMLVLACTALACLMWSRKHVAWAGVFLGLGIAAKLYPVLLLFPLAILCLRAGRMRHYAITVVAAVVAWLAVNVPWFVASPSGWLNFWTFNVDRNSDLGSFWLLLDATGHSVTHVNRWIAVLMFLGAIGLAGLFLAAPRRPRVGQGFWLITVLFLVLNKVYSPQYVLWLLPLLVLARPKPAAWLAFGFAEWCYFAAVWGYLGGDFSDANGQVEIYWLAIVLRIAVEVWISATVIFDIWHPEQDPVRAFGADDPDGGILDGVPDAPRPPTLSHYRRAVPT